MTQLRPVWADVDTEAIAANVRTLAALAAPARVCAVVKAAGYGHGAVRAAEAALAGGASWLAVALVEEGIELRDGGITAPVIVLSEPPADAFADVVRADLRVAVYTPDGVDAAAKAVATAGPDHPPLPVHVKVDTGMHRVGADPATAAAVARDVASRPELRLEGLWTHFAVADEPDQAPFTEAQLDRLLAVRDGLAAGGVRPAMLHAANSAGTIAFPRARLDLVRCGIAVYGLDPSPALAGRVALQPALSLRARVSFVKEVAAGEGASYGLRWRAPERTVVATVPIGYADGVPRRLSILGGEVLIGGHRRRLAGTVTMDQILVDCGPGADVHPGDEVVLIGRQGTEEIRAWEWADRLGTIGYEIVCGIGARVPRRSV